MITLFEADTDRIAFDHLVDRKMLANVTEKLDEIQPAQPLGVVQHEGLFVGREIKEALQLGPDGNGVPLGLLLGQQCSLKGLAARIADHSGAPAHEDERAMAAPLRMRQRHDRNQVSQMEAVRARVEAHVESPPGLGQVGVQILAGRGFQKAAPAQFLQKWALTAVHEESGDEADCLPPT